jgi:hypothetical protein
MTNGDIIRCFYEAIPELAEHITYEEMLACGGLIVKQYEDSLVSFEDFEKAWNVYVSGSPSNDRYDCFKAGWDMARVSKLKLEA